ncbi:MAG: class I SAM-dependent methyltransferase [Alphaproteobacteria bacterium]|nr:class I SAM-dependent methyltransferase [Alphaproteobacteria bacterium]
MNESSDKWRQRWRPDQAGSVYGEVMFRRATGELPEMESTKAVAARLARTARPGDHILDVGCGVGHYLRGLQTALGFEFSYTGVDATEHFVKLAQEAFKGVDRAQFIQGDIFELPFEDARFDIVMCNNVLLHLPTVRTPLRELCRVAGRHVLIRTLIGERSFRILEVHGPDEDYDDTGEPSEFNYFNIYSTSYVDRLLSEVPCAKRWRILPDRDFDAQKIAREKSFREDAATVTTMTGNWQTNGYILSPWSFVEIEIDH